MHHTYYSRVSVLHALSQPCRVLRPRPSCVRACTHAPWRAVMHRHVDVVCLRVCSLSCIALTVRPLAPSRLAFLPTPRCGFCFDTPVVVRRLRMAISHRAPRLSVPRDVAHLSPVLGGCRCRRGEIPTPSCCCRPSRPRGPAPTAAVSYRTSSRCADVHGTIHQRVVGEGYLWPHAGPRRIRDFR
jgi:hypothetical protein